MFIFSYKIFIRLISCFAFVAKRPKSLAFAPFYEFRYSRYVWMTGRKPAFAIFAKIFANYF